MRLNDYKVFSFDCYGTLIDWETGIVENLKPLTCRLNSALQADTILEIHAICESRIQARYPTMKYSDLLAKVYQDIAGQWNISIDVDESVKYGHSVGTWPAFKDSVEALKVLKKHFQLAILSNVDGASFAKSNQKLSVNFDYIYTAEQVGSYKPNPRNFEFMLENLASEGIAKNQILHVAESLFHDHLPANQFDLDNCWIHRRYQKEGFGATKTPEKLPTVKFKFNSLKELAQQVQKQV